MTDHAIETINRSCVDLTKAFNELAKYALGAMEDVTTSIGRLTQWKCWATGQGPGGPRVEIYLDTKPDWFQCLLLGIQPDKEVKHRSADQLQTYAEEKFGIAKTNEEVYVARIKDVSKTVESLCSVLSDVLRISGHFSTMVVIPSNPTYIKPAEDGMKGWLSSMASRAYDVTVSSQHNAATDAGNVMSELLENTAGLLTDINKELTTWTQVAQDQQAAYKNVVDVIRKASAGDYWGALDSFEGTVSDLSKRELTEAIALGEGLTSNIEKTLKLAGLDRKINNMGEVEGDKGWPAPVRIGNYSDPGPASQSRAGLMLNAQYFKGHIEFWEETSHTLLTLTRQFEYIPRVEPMFVQMPHFAADQSKMINGLVRRLCDDVFVKGTKSTARLAELLEETIRAYVKNEAENAALARDVLREVFG